MPETKWGILGASSSFFRRRAIPALNEAKSLKVVALASRSREKAEVYAKEFGIDRAYGSYEELICDPQIDVIYNPLPNGMHAEWTEKALAQGKHVLCEKPFASNAAEAKLVANRAKEAGRQVMEAFMWRFHPQHLLAASAIADGAIGNLKLVRGSFTFNLEDRMNVRFDPAQGGGCLLDVGAYPIAAARFYFGGEPESVLAKGTFDAQSKIDMDVAAILEFARGRALIDCSFDLPYQGDLELIGDKGKIFLPRAWQPEAQATVAINGKSVVLEPVNHYVLQFEHFSECILANKPARFGAEDAVKQMQVLDAVLKAISGQQSVAI